MALALHTIKKDKGRNKKGKVLGRGWSSGRGKTSGRGMKGQKARSGGRGGLKLKGMKSQIQSMPKLPGFKSHYPKMAIINLAKLEVAFKDGDKVTAAVLMQKGMISQKKTGLKILGKGELKKKLTVIADQASETAKQAIENSGGKLILTKQAK